MLESVMGIVGLAENSRQCQLLKINPVFNAF